MFRESDYKAPVPHPTYTKKPIPSIQRYAQNSKFIGDEGNTVKAQATIHDIVPEPVPATFDSIYRPSHRDSDWSGFVSTKAIEKRHERNHSSQQSHISHSEYGIVSAGDDDKGLQRKRRESAAVGASTSSLPYGTDSTGEEQWRTSYQRFTNQEGTSRDQLTLKKRHIPRTQLSGAVCSIAVPNNIPRSFDQSLCDNLKETTGSSQFYKPGRNFANQSLLSNLGASLTNSGRV